jgi:hypothetical protein
MGMLKRYLDGWLNVVGSLFIAGVWQVMVFLPLFVAAFFDEGSFARALALVATLIWSPLVAHKIGMLNFPGFPSAADAPDRKKDQEIASWRVLTADRSRNETPGDE